MQKPACFYNEPSLINRKTYFDQLKANGLLPKTPIPKKIIILYVPNAIHALKAHYENIKRIPFFIGDLHLIDERTGVLTRVGMGGPSLALFMEKLIALGAEEFVSIGMFGALDESFKIGQVIKVPFALRDEGTSLHYLPAQEKVTGQAPFTLEVFDATEAPTWTTDAFYRETASQLQKAKTEGAKVVDMETATFYAIAEFYKVKALALGVISDILRTNDWVPQFHQVTPQIEELLKLTVDAFHGDNRTL